MLINHNHVAALLHMANQLPGKHAAQLQLNSSPQQGMRRDSMISFLPSDDENRISDVHLQNKTKQNKAN
jgi:hypothetical protein